MSRSSREAAAHSWCGRRAIRCALAPVLRREVTRAKPDLRVRGVELQSAFVRQQMIRERLLATLSMFFAGVALLLAGIGLYGVLNARSSGSGGRSAFVWRSARGASHVVRRVTRRMVGIVCVGAVVGLAAGVAVGRVVEALLFEVTPTDLACLVGPWSRWRSRRRSRRCRRLFAPSGSIRRKRCGPSETVGPATRRG